MDQQATNTPDTTVAPQDQQSINAGILPLEEILKYENENVPYRFTKMFDLSEEEIEDIFVETKKWLWLCAIAYELKRLEKIDFVIGVIRGLAVIDQMWHNFILHTEAYQEFCDRYLGGYVHHVPTTKVEGMRRKALKELPDDYKEEFDNFYENQYSLTYDFLGEETCIKWYQDYAQKYSKPNLDKLRKTITKQPDKK